MVLECNNTINQRVERIVAAHADVVTGPNLGAALPHDDHAWFDNLSTVQFDATHFGLAITTIA
jgi:hypothetical protein